MRWFFKELYQRQKLNIKGIDDNKLKKLQNTKRGKKFISNASPNYDILTNPLEQDKFFYITVDQRHGNNSYDFIPACLYLGEDTVPRDQKRQENSHEV